MDYSGSPTHPNKQQVKAKRSGFGLKLLNFDF
jgi:hypothetical protein